MKRRYEQVLENWYQSSERRPMILRGARQVGKSTLVRIFANSNGLDLIEINLEKFQFSSLEKEHFTIEEWCLEIESLSGKPFSKNTLIFIDEIQAQPKAIAMLRYFYEERPQLAVIAAGSLLEIALHKEEISFPVGRVSFLWVSPMTFTEFLMARGREDLARSVLEESTNEYQEKILAEEVKKFFFVGGMPAAVKVFCESSSMEKVREIQRGILETYMSDFPKYSRRINVERMEQVFSQSFFHLGEKLIYQKLDSGSKSHDIKKAVDLLIKANVLIPVYHVNADGLPLKAGVDTSVKKLFFVDIGLVNCAHEFSWSDFCQLYDQKFKTKGLIAEQFVAQHFAYPLDVFMGPHCYYWLKDKASKKAEVDFILTYKKEILPVEVKASRGRHLKSLVAFAKEKKMTYAIKVSKEEAFSEKIVFEDSELVVDNIPFYALEGFFGKVNATN